MADREVLAHEGAGAGGELVLERTVVHVAHEVEGPRADLDNVGRADAICGCSRLEG